MDIGPLTISTASSAVITNTAAWPVLPIDNGATNDRASMQLLRLFVTTDCSTDATLFYLYFVLADETTVYGVVKVACTTTQLRSAVGGGSGEYLCTVDNNGRDLIDLLGMANGRATADQLTWRVGCFAGFPGAGTYVKVRGALTPIV